MIIANPGSIRGEISKNRLIEPWGDLNCLIDQRFLKKISRKGVQTKGHVSSLHQEAKGCHLAENHFEQQ